MDKYINYDTESLTKVAVEITKEISFRGHCKISAVNQETVVWIA